MSQHIHFKTCLKNTNFTRNLVTTHLTNTCAVPHYQGARNKVVPRVNPSYAQYTHSITEKGINSKIN